MQANANNNPSEQRALTTHSLSYLKRPAGGRPKPSQTEGSGSDDYDSGVDSDSENAAEEFSIFSKPIKPSDCKVHKVKLPNLIDPDMTQGLRNVPMPSPRGWNTPREFHPLPADYSGDTSADHDGRNPDLDRTLDTMLTDAGRALHIYIYIHSVFCVRFQFVTLRIRSNTSISGFFSLCFFFCGFIDVENWMQVWMT